MTANHLLFLLGVCFVSSTVSVQNAATELSFEANTAESPSVPRPTGRQYKTILAIDGGGIRLYFTNQILKKVEERIQDYILNHTEAFPEDLQFTSKDEFVVYLADYFDCISGTSGGSWIGLYLASKGDESHEVLKSREIVRKYGNIVPGTARGMDVFFLEYSDRIYPPGFLNYVRGISFRRSALFPLSIPGVNAPRHQVQGLAQALEDFLGELSYRDLHTSCLVNAYDLTSNGPMLFVADHISNPHRLSVTYFRSKNDPRRQFPRHNASETGGRDWTSSDFRIGDMIVSPWVEFKLTDVALASSAMPMYHPAHIATPINGSNTEFSFIDGGLVVSNPTLYSFNFVSSREDVNINDVAILSLGTGGVAGDYITNMNRGAVAWTLSGDLIDIVTDGSSEAKQAEVDYLFYSSFNMEPGQYLRINYFAEDPQSPEATAFSTFSSPNYLEAYFTVGQSTADQYSGEISAFIEDYVFSPKTNKTARSTSCKNF